MQTHASKLQVKKGKNNGKQGGENNNVIVCRVSKIQIGV